MTINSQELKQLLEHIWNKYDVVSAKRFTSWRILRRGRRPLYKMYLRANRKNYLMFFIKDGDHDLE